MVSKREFTTNPSTIFKSYDSLKMRSDLITLEDILHRDPEIDKLMSCLTRTMDNTVPDNVFIYGLPGTGKSTVTDLVTTRLERDAGRDGILVMMAHVNCEAVGTDVGILRSILVSICPEVVQKKIRNSFDAYFSIFCDAVNRSVGVPIIILDEIDKLDHPDVLNMFARIRENKFTDKNLCIIGVTNDLKFLDSLDPRTKSAMARNEIVFGPYNANQLRDILLQRSRLAFQDSVLSDTTIPLIAALAAQEHGDARKAINLLKVSGEIAERLEASVIGEEHVRAAKAQIEIDTVKETIKTFPTQIKLVLASCLLLNTPKPRIIETHEVYLMYKNLCSVIGLEILTQRRVTDYISDLAMLDIITARVVSKGRYGRTKNISLNIPAELARITIMEDSRLSPVINIDARAVINAVSNTYPIQHLCEE